LERPNQQKREGYNSFHVLFLCHLVVSGRH